MADSFPWYGIAGPTQPLEQGDILRDFPHVVPQQIPSFTGGQVDVPVSVQQFDSIILTQSCDLVNKPKPISVVLCPVYSLDDFVAADPSFKTNGMKEKIRRGEVIGIHMINEGNQGANAIPISVVDFRKTWTCPLPVVDKFRSSGPERFRLRPPYREQLAQAYARFIMRIGLPQDIPRFG